MAEEQVIALLGPRSVGKTTLLKALARSHGAAIIDLDDLLTREGASDDPGWAVMGDPPVFIDEYQRVPDLLGAIKAELNRDGSPGRFVIAGSTRHDALPSAAEALTGRLHLVSVYPLSQGEIMGHQEDLIEVLREHPATAVTTRPSVTTRDEYVDRIVRGGFPLALERSDSARDRWFDDYVTLSLERDLRELSRIQQRTALPRLLARLAGQTGQVLNITSAGADVGINKKTADNYTRLLEAVFLVRRLPAWRTTLRSREAAAPKLHMVDSGLAARLLGLSAAKLKSRDTTAAQQFGHLLETFVVSEILKQASWMDGVSLIGHWRTHDGVEVDLVLEMDDGSVIGFEVKATRRVQEKDHRGLRSLRGALGDRFKAGVVLHTGARSYTAEDRIHVMPVDRLWTPS